MKLKKLESGRSMVEILGVLAIIGVLSIGGIAGYSQSMRKHRANQIVDTASKFAVVAYGNCQQKLMSGHIENGGGCYLFRPLFEDAGVGSLPAGVKNMLVNFIAIDSANMTDTVSLDIQFTDEKLCQTVSVYAGNTNSNACDSDIPKITFDIKQN